MLNKHFDTNRVHPIDTDLAYSLLDVYSEEILDFLHNCLKIANTKENCSLCIPFESQSLEVIYHADIDAFEVIFEDIDVTDNSAYYCIRDLRDYLEHFYVHRDTVYQFALSEDEIEA